jgi:uncharacterized protein (TIGR00255 family)
MTGFATAEGTFAGRQWRWEAKSVNGRGLDIRFRLPDTWEGLEQGFRSLAAATINRGNVNISLRLDKESGEGAVVLNREALASVLAAAREVEDLAGGVGLHLAPATATSLLSVKGVLEADISNALSGPDFEAAARDSLAVLLAGLDAARSEEGARMKSVFATLIDEIEVLTIRAVSVFESQQAEVPGRLAAKVASILDAGAEVAADRLAQELALLAVKADIREELDRLTSHIVAARALLKGRGPVGRKLDFLTQEFNREVNTLCSKSGSSELTSVGLELKVVVDQMREQAQNVE